MDSSCFIIIGQEDFTVREQMLLMQGRAYPCTELPRQVESRSHLTGLLS